MQQTDSAKSFLQSSAGRFPTAVWHNYLSAKAAAAPSRYTSKYTEVGKWPPIYLFIFKKKMKEKKREDCLCISSLLSPLVLSCTSQLHITSLSSLSFWLSPRLWSLVSLNFMEKSKALTSPPSFLLRRVLSNPDFVSEFGSCHVDTGTTSKLPSLCKRVYTPWF